MRGLPRRLGMMGGIDNHFDAVLFIGYHSSTNNPQGVRAHTFSSASLTRVALNGAVVSEGSFNAALAGHFGAPVILVSGDDAAVAEVRAAAGPIEAVETKKSAGFHSADTLTPEAARELIYQRAKAALARRKDFKPYRAPSPVTVDITFKNYLPVEILSYLRSIERTDSHSIRFRAKDMPEAADFVEFVTSYDIKLEP
jgi:D-amino peptidase